MSLAPLRADSTAAAQATTHNLVSSPLSGRGACTPDGCERYEVTANISFNDFLDIFNPLQHIPVVGTLYRAITGDTVSPSARVMGGALYGGPVGAVAGMVSAVGEQTTGADPGRQLLGAMQSPTATAPATTPTPPPPRTAIASATPPSSATGLVQPPPAVTETVVADTSRARPPTTPATAATSPSAAAPGASGSAGRTTIGLAVAAALAEAARDNTAAANAANATNMNVANGHTPTTPAATSDAAADSAPTPAWRAAAERAAAAAARPNHHFSATHSRSVPQPFQNRARPQPAAWTPPTPPSTANMPAGATEAGAISTAAPTIPQPANIAVPAEAIPETMMRNLQKYQDQARNNSSLTPRTRVDG